MLKNIRERFAKSFLRHQVQELHRLPKQVNLESARHIAFLYYLSDEETYKKVETIIEKFINMKLIVRVLCYTDLKTIPHYFIPKLLQDIITSNDVNWRYQPVKPFFKEFTQTNFDILLDLSLSDHLPLTYCAALSKASLKIGRFDENHQMLYDLMIHTSPEETIESFTNQVIHYLTKINT